MSDEGTAVLVDERDPVPVRARVGALLRTADSAAFAVARIRLAALDFTEEEVARVGRCRVLLGHLDAGTLLDATEGVASGAAGPLRVLAGFAASGRLEVRAAGMAAWLPDFSVYDRPGCALGLVGGHYFGAPYPIVGPTFTAVLTDPGSVRILGERFNELWALGHDVLPAIRDVLENAHALALEAAGRGGGPDRPHAAG